MSTSDALPAVESAFKQLTEASGSVHEMFAAQFRVALNVLGNAITAAREGINAARVSDIDFALNDVVAVVDELSQSEAAVLQPSLELMRQHVARMQEETALHPEVLQRLQAFQEKLQARKKAVERQGFVEGGAAQPLPHPLEELREDAIPLARALAGAGYSTPSLDNLVAAKEELRLHQITELLDDLEVIIG